MLKRLTVSMVILGFLTPAAQAAPADQVKARQAYFHSIGRSMKGLNDQLRSSSPSKAEILKYTATLNSEAPKLVSYFPAGTGLDAGLKTGAKPAIWQKPAEFKADAENFAAAASKLDAAAHGDDAAALKAAFAATGNTCRTCHEAFRKEDH